MEPKNAPHGLAWSPRITSGSNRLRAAVTPFAWGQAIPWGLHAKGAPVPSGFVPSGPKPPAMLAA
jgi:hypothetical protein